MSLNPDIGHLFDDSVFGNIYTELDAKEYARTRQRNVREDCFLLQTSHGLERARQLTEKVHRQEVSLLRRSLYDIHARTGKPNAWDVLSNRVSGRTTRVRPSTNLSSGSELAKCQSQLEQGLENGRLVRAAITKHSIFKGEPRRPQTLPVATGSRQGKRDPQDRPQRPSTDDENLRGPGDRITNLPRLLPIKQPNNRTVNRPILASKNDGGTDCMTKTEDTDSYFKKKRFLKTITQHNLRKASYITASLDELYQRRLRGPGRLQPLKSVPETPIKLTPDVFMARQNDYMRHLMQQEQEEKSMNSMGHSRLPPIDDQHSSPRQQNEKDQSISA